MADENTPAGAGQAAEAQADGGRVEDAQLDDEQLEDEQAEDELDGDALDEEETDEWVMVIDSSWKPENEQDQPPETAIVGAWFVEEDGSLRRFRANHLYEPASEDSPTDPIDASLRLVMRGDLPVRELMTSFPGSLLALGLDEDENPIVTRAPDGEPSALVLTAMAHARRLTVPSWMEITAEALADSLPEEGVDVLLNPGAPASSRIGAREFREAVRGPDGNGQETGEAAERPATVSGPEPAAESAAAPEAERSEAAHSAAEEPADSERASAPADFDEPLPQPPKFSGLS